MEPFYSLTQTAESLARAAHRDQKYGLLPYHAHLSDVVAQMRVILALPSMSFFDHELAIAGAWLHDVLEDTKVTQEELCAAVGPRLTKLVQAVTDEPGANRRERKAKIYPKIRAAGPLAVALKLADRIANVSNCVLGSDDDGWSHGLLRMYRSEQVTFFDALYRVEDGLDSGWHRLRTMLG